jgi:hypothetical protein
MEKTLEVGHPKHKKGVAHHLPHRTRYRVPKGRRSKETAERIVEKISQVPGVKSVNVNHRTGSVFVAHDEHEDILVGLSGAFDSICDDLFEEVLEAESEMIPGFSVLAHLLKKRAGKIDHFLAEKTGNIIDLKMLVPVLLLGAGAIKMMRNRAWFHEVPAWVLLYYAYDSYLKFHPPETSGMTVRSSEGSANGAQPKRIGVRKQ